jgi:hypothetical protein
MHYKPTQESCDTQLIQCLDMEPKDIQQTITSMSLVPRTILSTEPFLGDQYNQSYLYYI